MNDRASDSLNGAPPVFVVQWKEKLVPTEHFGEVTLRAMAVEQFRLFSERVESGGPLNFGFELLCEMAHGANGERFTMASIKALPAFVMGDLKVLMDEASILCGNRGHDVKKN